MLEFLLTVNFEQKLGQLPQGLQGDHLAVHVGARAAIGADDPTHHQFAVEIDRLLRQPCQRRLRQGRKAGGDLGAFRALTRDIAGPAPAGNQQQGIDHDGLARAGLAGQGGEAAAELEFCLIDENEISQLKMREHGLGVGLSVLSAAAPMQLGAQQPIVVIARRMQQGDLRIGRFDIQVIALL